MIVKLLTEHHLEFLSLKGGCRGSPKSSHVKMPHCWKSHVMAHIMFLFVFQSAHNFVSFVMQLFILIYFLVTVKAAPHECVIRTCQP